jgi:hypothetical protein
MRPFILIVSIFMLLSASCRKTDATDKLISGSWHIEYFHNRGDEITGDFKPYEFTFKADGTVEVIGPEIVYGTWMMHDNDSKLHLSLPSSGAMSKLNKLWEIIRISSGEMDLADNINSANEVLYFKKD